MTMDDDSFSYEISPELALLIARANEVLARVEPWLPSPPPRFDWKTTLACRWRRGPVNGWLQPLEQLNCPPWDALKGIDEQKKVVDRNLRQFVAGLPANHVLLTGSRGCGKSSLIKAMLPKLARRGLRMIEVDKDDLVHLPDIVAHLAGLPYRFVVFTDDLSFEPGEAAYKPLKAALDGSLAGLAPNILICATSNRRHLMPEFMAENLATAYVGSEVHPGETTEEKVSLSDRFGLWLSFYPFDQDQYLAIAEGWVAELGGVWTDPARLEALQWATQRGGRSGRIARQFAADWAGRQGLKR
jgi:predicted AAA+ superfamily ATPase